MKIIGRKIGKWKEGYVTLEATSDEDLWHIYNLIDKGDKIRMSTFRKITLVDEKTGLKRVMRKRMTITLHIDNIEDFFQADRLCIRVKGTNAEEHPDLKIGQHHTFQIEINRKIKIIKECWSPYQINLIRDLSEVTHDVENAAITLDQGVAHLWFIKPSMTVLRHKVQKNIAKKSSGEEIYKKSLNKFFEQSYSLYKMIDFNVTKCLIIASPGFIAEQFYNYLSQRTQDDADKSLKKNLEKVVLSKCSSGYKNGLNEVLADPKVEQRMVNTKAINQSKLMEKFYQIMKKNQLMVAYGEKDVLKCIAMQAVDTLMISDSLFRTKDFKKRRVYNDMGELVKKYGGKVQVFFGLHPSGEKLTTISGIAAILRFEVNLDDDQNQQNEELIMLPKISESQADETQNYGSEGEDSNQKQEEQEQEVVENEKHQKKQNIMKEFVDQ